MGARCRRSRTEKKCGGPTRGDASKIRGAAYGDCDANGVTDFFDRSYGQYLTLTWPQKINRIRGLSELDTITVNGATTLNHARNMKGNGPYPAWQPDTFQFWEDCLHFKNLT